VSTHDIEPLKTTTTYPAAHGCFSGAVAETMKHFFGSDEVFFSVDSNVSGLVAPVRS
jgi:hypothetical protein